MGILKRGWNYPIISLQVGYRGTFKYPPYGIPAIKPKPTPQATIPRSHLYYSICCRKTVYVISFHIRTLLCFFTECGAFCVPRQMGSSRLVCRSRHVEYHVKIKTIVLRINIGLVCGSKRIETDRRCCCKYATITNIDFRRVGEPTG